jgi:hypothetical protein
MPSQNNRTKLLLVAFGLLCLGLVGIYVGLDPTRGLPSESSLVAAEGSATWHREDRHGVLFGLEGHETGFRYLSKGNASGQVAAALGSPNGGLVRVLYDSESPGGPIYDRGKYFTVFSVSVDGVPIRSYQQVADAWSDDNRIGYWGGLVSILASVAFALLAFFARGKT